MTFDISTIVKRTLVEPGSQVDLGRDFDTGWTPDGLDKKSGAAVMDEVKRKLFQLQDELYAESDHAVLIVLQAIDAAGKDSTIKHVMSGVNPQGVDVYSFKSPSSLERSHDYLWRHQIVAPQLGRIAIFNRSHYENVLVTRVHPEYLWPKTDVMNKSDGIWDERFREINDWERHLTENGTTVIKVFLNVSKEEQRQRFLARIIETDKNWKVAPEDMAERAHWDEYQAAFSDMLSNTSTEYAPWHVVPADHKWFTQLSTLAVVMDAFEKMDLKYPEVSDDLRAAMAEAKAQLESEA